MAWRAIFVVVCDGGFEPLLTMVVPWSALCNRDAVGRDGTYLESC